MKVLSLVLAFFLIMTVIPASANETSDGGVNGSATGAVTGGTPGGAGGNTGTDIDEGYISLEDFDIEEERLPLEIGDSKALTVKFTPDNASDKNLIWTSSNEDIATVNDGVVTAVGYGSALISAETSAGLGDSCAVDVTISGEIGSITWSIAGGTTATGNGELVISGNGEIPDYTIDNPAPWSQYMKNINEIYIKEGIKGIGDFAFYGCKYVHRVSISKTVETIGDGVFAGISCLSEFKVESGNEFFYEKDGALYSKDGKTLIAIASDNDVIYILPDSVTTIAPYAFYMNTVLRKVVMGNQLETIGESAFDECSEDISLYYTGTETEWSEKVQIGQNNEILSSVLFESKRLSGLTFNSSLIELETGNNAEMDIVTIPSDAAVTDVIWSVDDNSVASVANGIVTGLGAGITTVRAVSEDGGFVAKCKVKVTAKGDIAPGIIWEITPDLKTLTISGNGEIPDYSGTGYAPWEQYRFKVEKIVIGNGITKIGKYGFSQTSCKEVVLPDGLLYIGEEAFCFSESLEKINFPSGLSYIGNSAFNSCTKLESVNLPDSVTYIGSHAFNNCTKMVSLHLPEGIESIENGTFSTCQSLKAVKIPDSVKTIGTYAFWLCVDIETIVVGSGLKTVGYDAFHLLDSLKNVYYNGTSDTWNSISFSFDNDSIQNASRIYGYVPATKLELNNAELKMNVRDTKKLAALFTPQDASMPFVMWSSSNESVAVVDANGNVTAKSKGTAIITATAIGEGISASCSVETENVPATGMVIEESSVDMIKGRQHQLTLVFSPENATNRNINWTSSNEDVAEVLDGGILKAKGKGSAIVTGVTEDGEYTDSVAVTVTETIAEGVLDGGITWLINYEGNLTLKGTGKMPDFYPGEGRNDNGTVAGGSSDKEDSSWSETLAPWFDFNDEIKSVTVDSGITSIGDYAFAYCYNLENAHIAQGVTDIGKSAFENSSVINIHLPESVVSIGGNAFLYNNRLSYIYLPSNLKSIGNNAFEGCRELRSIALPQKLESIGDYAFSDSGLNYISIPESVKTIGEGAFSRLYNLGGISVEGASPMFKVHNEILYDKDMTRLLCSPSYISANSRELPSGIKKIDARAFSNSYNLNSIVLPEGLTTIGDEAFSGCSSLNSIYVPNSVTFIGKRAFSSCGFTYFSIPSGVTEISEGMLSGCWGLNDVYMSDSVTKIGDSAFSGSPLSNNCRFPKSLKEIGNHAFSSCQLGGDVKFPDGLEKIGERAFMYCQNINQIYIPASVNSIGDAAFVCQNIMRVNVDDENSVYTDIDGALYNKEMTSVILYPAWKSGVLVLPDGIKRVENYAFNRSRLSTIILPDGVTYIGENAFAECPELVSIRIPDTVTLMGNNVFSNNALLKSVGLPDGITQIPGNAFNNCAMLETVTLGKNVKTIKWSAFYNCQNLREVKVSSALEKIESNAFYQANNLATVYYEGNAEEWSAVIKEDQNEVLNSAQLITDAKFVLGVSIDKKNANLKIDDTLQLKADTLPDSLENSLVWKVADPGVATVENGVITAHRAGNTTVIVTSADGNYIDYCNISVSTEGSIGETINWSLADGVLTISGTGKIPDYDETQSETSSKTPWNDYKNIIKSIVIGEGITEIGNNVFRDSLNVQNITISQTVQAIGDRSFALCELVKKLNIPKKVSSIGEEAFEGMWELESFSVDTENEYFCAQDGVLFDKNKTVLVAYPISKNSTTYKIPSGVEKISGAALSDNRYLEALIMPEGLIEIGDFSFANIRNLLKVIIPESVNSVGQGVFMGTPISTIVYGGDDEEYDELVLKTGDNMGITAPVHIVYNSTMPVNGVMSEPVIENGKLRVNVWTEAMFEDYRLIIALYDNENKLVKMSMQDISDETTAASEFVADVEGDALGYTVKAFFWDNSDSIKILGKPLEFYVSPTIDIDTVLECPIPM